MLNAELHQLVLGDNQRIKLTVDFLLDGARGEQQVRDNFTHDTNDNLTASLHRKLRSQQRLGLDGDDNNQRGIARQTPGIGVLHFHQG